jgi:hydrogenase expression/formation protein HypE
VIVGPRFGEDAAVVDLGSRYLVLKSDPVTFTTAELGWYAVHVNANDIAVMGAQPRWFQPTILLPPGSEAESAIAIGRDIDRAARRLGIAVTGGHAEVSAAVQQPVVAGDMQGIVRPKDLILTSGVRPGDVLAITKTAGIEGTAILARDHPRQTQRVLGARGQATAARFHLRPGISVVREAQVASRHRVDALHDPTEGGVAMGLYEMATAARCRIRIDLDAIPIHAFTLELCRYFGLRPLGLIASGALLAAVPRSRIDGLLRAWRGVGVRGTVIGTADRGTGVEAWRGGRRERFVFSERDELARLTGRQRTGRRQRLAAQPSPGDFGGS